MLSTLISESTTLLLEKQALGCRVGFLQGTLASYRNNLLRILRNVNLDLVNKTIVEGMVLEINENTWGTVHHDPTLEPTETMDT